MRAICWHGKSDVRVDTVPDPKIEDPRDAIVRITSTCICGSDLHLYDGYMPTMEAGDILGHEPMGVVEEVGKSVTKLKKGDRVVVPFTISCGTCWFCERQLYSLCDNSNPNAEIARKAMGQSPAGLFGYSHMLGGYAGGQARVPPRPVRRRRPGEDPRRHPRREGRVPLRHLPDRLHGRRAGARSSRATPSPSGAAGRSASSPSAAPGCSGPGGSIAIDRVPERLEMARGRQGRDDQLRGEGRLRHADGDDQGPRAGPLHRRGGGRGARRRQPRRGARQGEGGGRPGHRPAARAPRGDHVLPQGRHRLDPRRLHRVPRQDPDGRRDEQGADLQDGPDARPAATPSRCWRRSRRARSTRRSSSRTGCRWRRAPTVYKTFRDKKDGCIKVVLKP